MIVHIYYYPIIKQTEDEAFCNFLGTIEMDNFDKDECFNICNWSCFSDNKPENLHSDIVAISSGVCFENTETGTCHFAKSIGWVDGSKDCIENYVKSCAKKGIYI